MRKNITFIGMSILIVDDVLENIKIVMEALKPLQCDLMYATSGIQVMERISKNLPDLILLDIMMPGMGGYEVCQNLKKDTLTQSIPVIFLSAKDETKNIVKGFEVGAVDYISKPFQVAELLARVTTQLNLKLKEKHNRLLEQELFASYRSEAVQELIRNIAHQWRQPLNVIGFSITKLQGDLEEKGLLDSSVRSDIQQAYQEVLDLSKTIDLFADKVRSQSLRKRSLDEMVQDLAQLFGGRLNEQRAVLQWNVSEGILSFIYPETLFDVLVILIANALDMASIREVGTPVITISADIKEDRLVIDVSDNCGGITEVPIDKVFDPYSTGHFPERKKGLSLYIAKHVVASYLEGAMGARNNPAGASFTLTLPQ